MNDPCCPACGKSYGPVGEASDESCVCLHDELRSLLRKVDKEPEPESTKVLDSLDEIC